MVIITEVCIFVFFLVDKMKKSGKKSTSSSRQSMPNIRSTEQLLEQVSFNPLTTRIPCHIAVN